MNGAESVLSGQHPRSDIVVIIPVMNRSRYITSALDAILEQTFQPDYLIVVDDCSTDNTVAEVQTWFNEKRPLF